AKAEGRFLRAVDAARRLGDPLRLALVLGRMARLFIDQLRFEEARGLLAEASEQRAAVVHPTFVLQRIDLGDLERTSGNAMAAEAHYREALASAREQGVRLAEGGALLGLGATQLWTGRVGLARGQLAAAAELLREAPWSWASLAHAYLALAIDDPTAAAAELEQSRLGGGYSEVVELVAAALPALAGDREAAAAARRQCQAVELAGRGQELSFAARLIARLVGSDDGSPRRVLTVGPELSWFQVAGQEPVNLGRRRAIRRILADLVGAHDGAESRTLYQLIEAGWPGESIQHEAAINRFHVTMTRLRKLGLEQVLIGSDEGYRLARDTRIEHSPASFSERRLLSE
ncbi:MAG: hypothetical protein KJO07_14265, partial [Deltaproteobacteria bacterium]|nr:hypothetical protein [Deltaproteobacteria bacterium]